MDRIAVFCANILACPARGGRLRLLATITQLAVIEKILTHLGLPVELPEPTAARTPKEWPGRGPLQGAEANV